MTAALPRVTYSNIAADFTPLHDWLDEALPKFRADMLGRAWPNIVGNQHNVSGTSYDVHCPFDRNLLVARLVAGDEKAVRQAVAAAREAYPGWSGRPWQERVALMRRWAEEIDRRKYDLGMAALFEVGKSRLEAIGEAEDIADPLDGLAGFLLPPDGKAVPLLHGLSGSWPGSPGGPGLVRP